jgi:arylsulfatase A-like enzyme
VQRDWKYTYWWYQDDSMQPFEELFNTRSDPLELANLARNPEAVEKMAELQAEYDRQIATWKREAVEYNNYRGFGTLFDRNASWEEKVSVLKKGNGGKRSKKRK